MPGSTERLIKNLQHCGFANLAAAVKSPESSELIKEGAFGHLNVRVVIRDLSEYGREVFEKSVRDRPSILLPCEHLRVEMGKMEVQSDRDSRFKADKREEYNRMYVVYVQNVQSEFY